MTILGDYPHNFIKEITFPRFTEADCQKLNNLFDMPFDADLVRFLSENSEKTSTKTCLIMPEGEECEVRGFISKWIYPTWYDQREEILSIEYEEGYEELKELHQNYLLLAEVNHIDTLWIGIKDQHKGKVVLLDEQRGQDFQFIWDYCTSMGNSLQDFLECHCIDFEQHKEDENLFW